MLTHYREKMLIRKICKSMGEEKKFERRQIAAHESLCPYQSDPTAEVACNPKCALYRKGKAQAFVCQHTEFTTISWAISGKQKRY
jgi:hypothetical protein